MQFVLFAATAFLAQSVFCHPTVEAIMSNSVRAEALKAASAVIRNEAADQFTSATKAATSAISKEEKAMNKLHKAEIKLASGAEGPSCMLFGCRPVTKELVEELRKKSNEATARTQAAKIALTEAFDQDVAARNLIANLEYFKQILNEPKEGDLVMSSNIRQKGFEAVLKSSQKTALGESVAKSKDFVNTVTAEGRAQKNLARKMEEFAKQQSDDAKAALEKAKIAASRAEDASSTAQNAWNAAANQLRASQDSGNKPFFQQIWNDFGGPSSTSGAP